MSRIFLISDNHFGSEEVIEYFNRINPKTGKKFRDSKEMDDFMIERWNQAVGRDDIVFSLGDFTWAGDWKSPPRFWWEAPETYQSYLNKLHGHIVLVHGNHDPWASNPWDVGGNILHHKGRMFYLSHIPESIPQNWKDWAIHGHHHMMLPKYPFIDGQFKNINVSCEMVNYTPVELDRILSLGIDNIKRLDMAPLSF